MSADLNLIVVNKYHSEDGIYIGRGSPLGNPYSCKDGTKAIYKSDSREDSIEAFEWYLRERIDAGDKSIIGELERIYAQARTSTEEHPTKLKCFCKPKSCHGDIIVKVIKEFHASINKGGQI
jgi:hypothetical protein